MADDIGDGLDAVRQAMKGHVAIEASLDLAQRLLNAVELAPAELRPALRGLVGVAVLGELLPVELARELASTGSAACANTVDQYVVELRARGVDVDGDDARLRRLLTTMARAVNP